MTFRPLFLLVTFLATLALYGCSKGGYQRGMFQGYVIGETQESIISKVGKPDTIDTSDAKSPRLVYKDKTFDPDNMNKVDATTTVRLEKNKEGVFVGAEVIF